MRALTVQLLLLLHCCQSAHHQMIQVISVQLVLHLPMNYEQHSNLHIALGLPAGLG
jgi:hypothetical protein